MLQRGGDPHRNMLLGPSPGNGIGSFDRRECKVRMGAPLVPVFGGFGGAEPGGLGCPAAALGTHNAQAGPDAGDENRIRGLMATQGVLELEMGPGFPERLK